MCGAEILPIVLMTRQTFIIADISGCSSCDERLHNATKRSWPTPRSILIAHFICASLPSMCYLFSSAAANHQLLHTRNNNKLQRAIRFRGFIQFRDARIAPLRWRWHAQLQDKKRLQSRLSQLRKILRQRLDLLQVPENDRSPDQATRPKFASQQASDSTPAVKLKTWRVVEKLIDHPRKLARSFAVGSRRINDARQRAKHRLRPLLITPVFFHRLDNGNECSEWSNVVVAHEPSQHHLLVLLVRQSQLFQLQTDHREPAIHIVDVSHVFAATRVSQRSQPCVARCASRSSRALPILPTSLLHHRARASPAPASECCRREVDRQRSVVKRVESRSM